MSNAIVIQGVSTAYGKRKVLHDVSFDVPAGQCFGLIGLNGAGKTTLIKILLGLRNTLSGHVSLMGQAPGESKNKAQIAYLPEKFEPPAFLTGYEFIEFTQKLYGRSIAREAIDKAARQLQLQLEALPGRVTTYSKGMRQKLGLMATLLSGCPLVILDEPMSGLDPQARILVKETITAYQKQGNTVIICSHILADLDEMCPSIAVLHHGYQVFYGTPDALKQAYQQATLERAFLSCIQETEKLQAA